MTESKRTLKLRISFTGMEGNALRGIRELEELAKEHEDFDDGDNSAYAAKACISAYRDTILALCKGTVDIKAVKDFWFHNQDVAAIPFRNEVIKFDEESEAA
jgi:hypothetical protein